VPIEVVWRPSGSSRGCLASGNVSLDFLHGSLLLRPVFYFFLELSEMMIEV
jgi:hypothetical protein